MTELEQGEARELAMDEIQAMTQKIIRVARTGNVDPFWVIGILTATASGIVAAGVGVAQRERAKP